MDGCSAKKSTSLETLVIQNISNVNDLKAKLNDIIKSGKNYEYDVSSCIKSLLQSSDQEIVLLSVQAISELAKCEEKRETYAQKDIIHPILNILKKEITSDINELLRHCCRVLGNLCCDCDTARSIILECNGVPILADLVKKTIGVKSLDEVKVLAIKTFLNFGIGGQEFSEAMVEAGLIDIIYKILQNELYNKDDMDDNLTSAALLILSVINDNRPEFQFHSDINISVLNILKETTNIDISELCLEHLHAQAEHDSVKNLLAKEGGIQLVCSRLEQLIERHEAGELNAEDSEVDAVIKQACDLIVIVLTGDEAMHLLYNKGVGETYLTVLKWLDSSNHQLLTTALLALGNFARQDDYCIQMMQDNIFEKLLDIFEAYHSLLVSGGCDERVSRVQHAVASALRNLAVPPPNKRTAAARGRATPLLVGALPHITDHHVAYKVLATLRMLIDGHESGARQLVSSVAALSSVARWGCGVSGGGAGGGAAGEAPRLLAWAVRQLRRAPPSPTTALLHTEGCISCLVNMLVASHSVMQNEAILALTLLAMESLNNDKPHELGEPQFDCEKSYVKQLISSEIGKHVSVLIETNCAKMPVEVAENLLAFLDITSKTNKLASDYKESGVHESLQKFMDARKDFSDDLKCCITSVIHAISDNKK